jgi:hypothetical protein
VVPGPRSSPIQRSNALSCNMSARSSPVRSSLIEETVSGQPSATLDFASMGSPLDSESANSHSSTGGAPEGFIEAAVHHCLWDEDHAVGSRGIHQHHHGATTVMPSASIYNMYASDGQAVGLTKTSKGLLVGPSTAQQRRQGFGSCMASTKQPIRQ